jgi:hypothetical protein
VVAIALIAVTVFLAGCCDREPGWFALRADLPLASDEGDVTILAGSKVWSGCVAAIRRPWRMDPFANTNARIVTDAELRGSTPFWLLGIRRNPSQSAYREAIVLCPLENGYLLAGTSVEELWAAV